MTHSAPTLIAERVTLRAFQVADLPALAAIWADPEVVTHLGGKPLSLEETWRKALGGVGQWALFGFGYWVVERNADHSLIGHMGFADFQRGLDPAMDGAPELGYVFATSVHGQGIAREACAAALEWLGERTSWAIISPANAPSIALAERLGYVSLGQRLYHDAPTLLLKRG